MPNLYDFSQYEILAFFLVLLRVSAFIVSWPVFGTTLVPRPSKILFALVISLMVFPSIGFDHLVTQMDSPDIIWLCLKEVFIGLSFGYLCQIFFYAVRICGEIISVSMGLSSSQLFNPALGGQTSSIEQFQVVLASLFFLAINGHHLFLGGLVDSFRILPLSGELINLSGLIHFGEVVQDLTIIGIKLSAPVMIAILFMNITMAVVGRAVPQINVLITSLPVNILIGFLVMIVSLPLFMWQMNDLLEYSTHRVFQFLKTF